MVDSRNHADGFGLPILEAMALGVPVITSNRTSMPEVAGDAAILVDPEDISSIRNAMEQVIESPEIRRDLIQKGVIRSKAFNWKTTAEKTIKAYEAAVKSNK